MSIWQRYLTWRTRHAAAVLLTADGFTIKQGRECRTYPWIGVERITAFKRDLLSYDCVCLRLLMSDGTVQLDEEMSGFAAFREMMEHVFELTPDWRATVAFPAFKPCERELYIQGAEPC